MYRLPLKDGMDLVYLLNTLTNVNSAAVAPPKTGVRFNEAKTNCGIARILGMLLMMNSHYNIYIFGEATVVHSLSPSKANN